MRRRGGRSATGRRAVALLGHAFVLERRQRLPAQHFVRTVPMLFPAPEPERWPRSGILRRFEGAAVKLRQPWRRPSALAGHRRPHGLAVTLFYAGLFKAWTQAEIGPAESLLADCLRLARQSGPEWLIYIALMRLGDLARLRGEGGGAEDLLGASLVLAGAANDRWSLARCLYSLAAVRLMRHDGAQARSLLLESLSLAIGLQDRRGISYAVDGLGCVAAAEGQASGRQPVRHRRSTSRVNG